MKSCDEDKRLYLELIQNIINRMATSSAIVKGLTATITAGILTIHDCTFSLPLSIFFFVPIICMLCLDTTYLWKERQYRRLYELVCKDEHTIDLDLDVDCIKDDLKNDRKTKWINCMFSWSIWLFYVPLLAVIFIVWFCCN